jgi:hypothetical protein
VMSWGCTSEHYKECGAKALTTKGGEQSKGQGKFKNKSSRG